MDSFLNNRIHFFDIVKEAATKFGTPFYLYDEQRIILNVSRFKNIRYPQHSIHFATMANDNIVLLNILRRLEVGAFVNSLKHYHVALASGFSKHNIIYASTGLTPSLILELGKSNIRLHLDSIEQVCAYGRLFPDSSIGVRINIQDRSQGRISPAHSSRIGILEDEFTELFAAANTYQLRIVGTHSYLGTNLRTTESMLEGVDEALRLSSAFTDLEYIDLGGGFPADNDSNAMFDFEEYATAVSSLFHNYSLFRGRPIALILEPGRAILSDAGFFCTRITEVKERPDRLIAMCDASVSIFPRPLINREFHPTRLLQTERDTQLAKKVDIAGSTTFSNDYLARDLQISHPSYGDLILFELAGSYCSSMMSRFLGQDRPPEILYSRDGTLSLISKQSENTCTSYK
jgi:diaminopimelate decarboxylase